MQSVHISTSYITTESGKWVKPKEELELGDFYYSDCFRLIGRLLSSFPIGKHLISFRDLTSSLNSFRPHREETAIYKIENLGAFKSHTSDTCATTSQTIPCVAFRH